MHWPNHLGDYSAGLASVYAYMIAVHARGVSVEIELKMDWQWCKKVFTCNCQIVHLIDQWD